MYLYEIQPSLQQKLKILLKKDKSLYEQIIKKINEIINSSDIEHYKNLRYNMKEAKRVHIVHFVLIFSFNKNSNMITFLDFDHRDNVYKR
jgi:mRNA-degrading endonuclease RelE of RelBE toxin-antitoxin system